MLNERNQNLYKINKIKDFENKNEMHQLKKEEIVRRINSRLEKFIENKQKNNVVVTSKDCKEYISKQIEKMDVEEKIKKRKRSNNMFKTTWGEDIYRDNAFLGAEANRMSEYSKMNKQLENYIRQKEKIGRKPTEQEINTAMLRFMSDMDKKSMDEAQILRRKSIPHILEAMVYHSEPIVLPFFKDNKECSTIMLKLDASSLSYAEVRELKEIFKIDHDTSGNTLVLEVAIVENTIDSEETMYAQETVVKNVADILIEKLKHKMKYDKEKISSIMEEIDNIKKTMDADMENKKIQRIEENKKMKKKLVKSNILMLLLFISMCSLLIFQIIK